MHAVAIVAQVDAAVEKFNAAAERFGLANTILMVLVIVMFALVACVGMWIKPRLDAAFSAHLTLIGRLTDKIDKWPSDVNKLCQAESALKSAGFDSQTIAKLLALKRRENNP